MFAVVSGGVEIGHHDVRIQAGDGFYGCVLAGEFTGAAAIGSEAGEQVGGNDDEALCGQLVGHFLGPVAEAEDLVNENDHGGFGFYFGINHEGLNGAIAMLQGYVFVMAGRRIEAGLCPVLRLDGDLPREKEARTATASLMAYVGIANFMGRSLVTDSGGRKGSSLRPCKSGGRVAGVDACDGAVFR